MKNLFFSILFILSLKAAYSQVLNNTTTEVVGSPTWSNTVSLGKDGLVLILKEDQTRFKVLRYDRSLNKLWEQNLFMDTEKSPASSRVYHNRLALLFSETSGMFYQILDFDLNTGEYKTNGFELREFFQDSGLLIIGRKSYLVGINEKGIGYYVYDAESEEGKLVQTELAGTYVVEEVDSTDDGNISVLAVEKTMGYSNEAKKKGEYIKSTAVISVVLDTAGVVKSKKTVSQNQGKFPLSASSDRSKKAVSGIYQDSDGNQGLYLSFIHQDQNVPVFYQSFASLFPGVSAKNLKRLLAENKFYLLPVKENQNGIYLGGIFYSPKYKTKSSDSGYDPVTGRRQTVSESVFSGIEFSRAYLFNLDWAGNLQATHPIDVNLLSKDLNVPFTYNDAGAVAYLSNGSLLVKNFEISNKPIVYKLTDDQQGKSPYIAAYNRAIHWYDNVFLALGSQNKVEAFQMEDDKNAKPSKKKKQRPFIQTRRTYFLTSVSAGQTN